MQRLKFHLGMTNYTIGDTMVDLKGFENAHYLTVAEVALAMRVSSMTVYRLVHSGELPAVRFGRSYRVPALAVEEYLIAEQHAASPGHPPQTT
jgi:excisionase family DNA binding protein